MGLVGLGRCFPEDLPAAGLRNHHPRALHHRPNPALQCRGLQLRPLCSSLMLDSHRSVLKQWKKEDLAFSYIIPPVSLPRAAWPACRAILGAPAPQKKPSPAEIRGPTSPPEPHASPRSLKLPQSHPGRERRDPGSHNRHSTCPSLCVSGWVGRKPAASCPRHRGHRHVPGAAGGGKVGKGARQPRLSGHGRAITSQAWHCCVLSPPQRQGHAGRHRGTLASPHHDPRPPPLCQAVCKCQLPVSTSSRFTPFVFFIFFIFFFSAPPPAPFRPFFFLG